MTAYAVPVATWAENVKGTFPFPETDKLLPPLFCRTSPPPMRPETEPPIVRPFVPQLIWTLETLAVAVPLAFTTVQDWTGLEGCVLYCDDVSATHGGLEGESAICRDGEIVSAIVLENHSSSKQADYRSADGLGRGARTRSRSGT